MKTLAFTVSKGGVGKSLVTANAAAALAKKGKSVILLEGDPSHPLQLILGMESAKKSFLLEDVVRQDAEVEKAVCPTGLDNLFLIQSGVSLQGYFDISPIRFAEKITSLNADFLFVDTPFPLGKAAFLSLGICEYFVPILTEDEFVLCVESAIDTIRLGKYYFKCIPLGFILNRIKNLERFNESFIKDLEDLLEIRCLARIREDQKVSRSYGATSEKAFLAYQRLGESEFARKMDEIATFLLGGLPKTEKRDPVGLLEELIHE